MSISIEEARRKLDVLDALVTNPQLILTELFTEAVSGCNYLYQINIDGKYIFDYLIEHLMKIPVFHGCIIRGSCSDISIYVDPIRQGECQDFLTDDKILEMDLDSKTFKFSQGCLLEYKKLMEPAGEMEVATMGDWWSKCENLTFLKRLQNATSSLSGNKRKMVKIRNFIFWLNAPQERIDQALQKERERVRAVNKRNEDYYAERLARQEFYSKRAPAQIERIESRQREIAGYLTSIGFQERLEMSN